VTGVNIGVQLLQWSRDSPSWPQGTLGARRRTAPKDISGLRTLLVQPLWGVARPAPNGTCVAYDVVQEVAHDP
jgi:hypothetical protein